MKAERSMTLARRVLVALTLAVPVTACGGADEGVEEVPATILQQRTIASRQACAAKELEQTAEENLAFLQPAPGSAAADDPLAATRAAAAGFTRGYFRHAQLRHALFALVDSALNYSSTPADSLLYEERANAFSMNIPAVGTVEANAVQSYDSDLRQLLADADHPCNWNIPWMDEPL